jgi:hypothetical protein
MFSSRGIFRITLSSALGGADLVVTATGPTCIALSGPHAQAADPSGPLGDGSSCPGSPSAATSDATIGLPFPPGFNAGNGVDEVHTEILAMSMSSSSGIVIRAGAGSACVAGRSLGEVEARGGASGFGGPGARSFFKVHFAIDIPASIVPPGVTLYNRVPLLLQANGITGFPPSGATYLHMFDIEGSVQLWDCATQCLVGTLSQGSHSVGPAPGMPPPPPRLVGPYFRYPIVFSVAPGAEGLIVPDPCIPPSHVPPNDVFGLGSAGLTAMPPSWGYATAGELFLSPGTPVGFGPDTTNVDRISASLGIGPSPGGPPYSGPFSPSPGAPAPAPAPPGGPGIFGLVPSDNINSVSFGCDWGDTLFFSVSPASVGAPGTAAAFHSTLSPTAASLTTGPVPSNGGGDPGDEAAGDVYVGATSFLLPLFGGSPCPLGVTFVIPAPLGGNFLAVDEVYLGLQAPAVRHSIGSAAGGPGSPPEDDVDALEVGNARFVDAVTNSTGMPPPDGIVDAGSFVFFTLAPGSPSLAGPFTPDDILVSSSPGFFSVMYADGVADIGLLAGDVVDGLVLRDFGGLSGSPNGFLAAGDMALFSLAPGSPSLAGSGANPNMPGPGPFSPADVFFTPFPGPPAGGAIALYAPAAFNGLLAADDIDALDIGISYFGPGCLGPDADGDGVRGDCDNCPNTPNPFQPHPLHDHLVEQRDSDGDGLGDVCDPCPFEPNQTVCDCFTCPGDTNADGFVGVGDFTNFVIHLLNNQYDACSDVNRDGKDNGRDIQLLVTKVLAEAHCGPCVVETCVPGKINENEPDCGLDPNGQPNDTTNGGCNVVPHLFTSIPSPASICGTAAYNAVSGFRGTDWYEVVIPPGGGQVQRGFGWSVTAEFDVEIAVIRPDPGAEPCGPGMLSFEASGGACENVSIFQCFDVSPGDRVWFFVAPAFNAAVPCGARYNAELTEPVCTPPSNDDCVGAIAIPTNVLVSGSTIAATTDGPAITCENNCSPLCNMAHDVWYKWTPPASGPTTFTMCEGLDDPYDGILVVYNGACPPASSTCNDDGCAPSSVSRITSFNAALGTTYWIRVSGWSGQNGNFRLRVTQP